jgi:hypothetical protein
MFLGGEVVRSTCRREAWHNINWRELSDRDPEPAQNVSLQPSICIADRAVKTITQVARMALNVELRTPGRPTLHFHHEMNMWRLTGWIRDRFDGAKIVLAR